MMAAVAGLVLLPLGLAAAALSDLRRRTIPNGLVLALVAAFALLAPLAGLTAGALALHGAAGAAMLAGGFLLFAAGIIGAGDAKLAAATALWLGWPALPAFLLLLLLASGVLALATLLLRRHPAGAPAVAEPAGLPLALAIAAAGLALLPASIWASLA
jgi:prepilin peptidase CpaA